MCPEWTENPQAGQVDATFLQPFLVYTWPSATSIALNTETTYDWKHSVWTVPLNLSVSQGHQPGSEAATTRRSARRARMGHAVLRDAPVPEVTPTASVLASPALAQTFDQEAKPVSKVPITNANILDSNRGKIYKNTAH